MILQYIVLGLLFCSTLTLCFFLMKEISRLQKRIDYLVKNSSFNSIEETIKETYRDIEALKSTILKNDGELQMLLESAKKFINKCSLLTYNAYGDMGGDISFVLCLLDGNNNGVLVDSLHSRTNTRIYSKYIRNGESDSKLSTEENQCLQDALSK